MRIARLSALALALAACGGGAEGALSAAVEACGVTSNRFITVDEGGLFMDGQGEESPGAQVEEMSCILDELETPSSVVKRISNTTALMGLVEGEWGDYQAEWTYHPSNGLDIAITVKE